MKTVGFPISRKENERRRALIPEHVKMIHHPECLYFEEGYGKELGYTDNDYRAAGCNIVPHEEVLKKDIICDPKIGDAEYLDSLQNQIIFGWIHATQNKDITDKLVSRELTGFAWEKMFYKGRHVFWRNNEIAGEAAVMHAFQCYGKLPYECNVAVIGKGNTARGAMKMLSKIGASVTQYDRRTEGLLREEIGKYDVIVNCVLWDVYRKDHIIYKSDLQHMKCGAMIIDVSCDRNGGVETSVPTTIGQPVYSVDGILHYVVDHTPSLFYKSFTSSNSAVLWKYINELISGELSDVMNDCLIVDGGKIVDQEIIKYQGR